MKKTVLNAQHHELGARMVEFGGWEMPVQYSGVIAEHLAVRSAAGLFDVSHMGEIEVSGPQAADFLQYATINDISGLDDGQVQYTALCYETGGVVDDLTLYRFAADHYMLCVNAANAGKDLDWLLKLQREGDFSATRIDDRGEDYALLALQGPCAVEILAPLCDSDLGGIRFYRFARGRVAGVETIISRTGYTGEDGFELYCPVPEASKLWRQLLHSGKGRGLVPAGLGARDTLRLEKALALYGHEISAEILPLEARLGWITKLDKGPFVGREALRRAKDAGLKRQLIGLTLDGPGVPRQDYPVLCAGEQVGHVTSGTMSPTLKQGIALALVTVEAARGTAPMSIQIRQREVPALKSKLPFVPHR